MALTDLGSLGSIQNKTSGTLLTMLTVQATAVGDIVIVQAATDNSVSTVGATTTHTSVVDAAGNTYTKVSEQTNGTGGANAGVTLSVWWSVHTSSLASGETLTLTRSGAVVAKAMSARRFGRTAGSTLASIAPVVNTATGVPAALTISGMTANIEKLVYRSSAVESNAASIDTATSGWTLGSDIGTSSGSAATNVSTRAESIIGTDTSYTSQPTGSNLQGASIMFAVTETVPLAFNPDQKKFAFYVEDPTEGMINQGENTSISKREVEVLRLLRIQLQESGGLAGAATDDYQLYYSKNGGAYTPVTASSSNIRAFNSPSFTEGQATSLNLTAGTGSFVAGKVSEDGTVDDLQLTAYNHTELLYSIEMVPADVATADTFDFRVYRNGAPLTAYTVTPRLTIAAPIFTGTQVNYRFYASGTEAGSTALAAQNTAMSAIEDATTEYQVRVLIQETAGASGVSTDDYALQFRLNGGAWTNFGSFTEVKGAVAGLTNGSATTSRLTGGSGTFVPGEQATGGSVADFLLTGSNFTELVYGITLGAAPTSGDVLELRVRRNAADLNAYTTYPTINVVSSAPTLQTLTANLSIMEDSPDASEVGTPTGYTAGSTKTLDVNDDGGGRFQINSTTGTIYTTANPTNYEDATSHTVTIIETLAGAIGSPKSTQLTITVLNNAADDPPIDVFVSESGTLNYNTGRAVGEPFLPSGADGSYFQVVDVGGVWHIQWATGFTPDYDAPSDANLDNTYELTLNGPPAYRINVTNDPADDVVSGRQPTSYVTIII